MRTLISVVKIMAVLVLCGCSVSGGMGSKKNEALWDNAYKGDPKLAGVVVSQFPEGLGKKDRYEGRHPSCIWYVFWNGDVKSVQYTPSGEIEVASMWKGYCRKGDSLWKEVDFRYGSDPGFVKHMDPRK